MSFRTLFASLCNHIFCCFSFDEDVDQDFNCSEYVTREILSELSIVSTSAVCKAFGNKSIDVDDLSYSSCWSELNNSVIHGILVKLPIKSIIQCRYVCTSWNKLISEPYFSKVYFNNLTLTTYIAFSRHKNRVRCPDDEFFGFLEISQNGNITRQPMNLKALTSPVPGIANVEKSWTSIIGSCDGLLCLVEIPYDECYTVSYHVIDRLRGPSQTVWIVNPLIGEYMKLPKVHEGDHDTVVYGFGSVVDGDQYKVLRITMKNYSYVVCAQILTIGVDKKWRDLDTSTFPGSLYSHGVVLNGVLHWVGYCRHGNAYCHVIYAFDIGKETGQYFRFPFEHYPFNSFLVAWDGHLCIIDNKTKVRVDLWTMKRYGVFESWTRDIVLTNNNLSAYFYELIPVTTMKNGDLLLLRQFDQSLMSFDLKTKKCVELEVSKLRGICFSMLAYTPSFVSLCGMISR